MPRLTPFVDRLAAHTTKAIVDSTGRTELHDLAHHPVELHPGDFAAANKTQLRHLLHGLPRQLAAKAAVSTVIPLDDQRREQIRGLGYVE
jgi:hypothetical protein